MDFYAILAVDPSASADEIRKAFYKLALKLHPDKNNGQNLEKFAAAREAFETLSDPDRRAQYNRQLGSFISREQQNLDTDLRKQQLKQEQQYFALKLAQHTKCNEQRRFLSKTQLKRETQIQKSALAEIWQDDPKYRTLADGRIFNTVKEARHHVDTHPNTALLASFQHRKYSVQLEKEVLERLKLRSAHNHVN